MKGGDMPNPTEGARFRYAGEHGLGQAARIADPDVPEALNTLASGDRELDMPDGTEATVLGHDDERDLVLIEWTDSQGMPRITSIPPAEFAANFQEA